jgi:hypothetical protein
VQQQQRSSAAAARFSNSSSEIQQQRSSNNSEVQQQRSNSKGSAAEVQQQRSSSSSSSSNSNNCTVAEAWQYKADTAFSSVGGQCPESFRLSSSRAGGIILGVDVCGAGAGATIASKLYLWQGFGRWRLDGLALPMLAGRGQVSACPRD